jgi:hypothetical protein
LGYYWTEHCLSREGTMPSKLPVMSFSLCVIYRVTKCITKIVTIVRDACGNSNASVADAR